MEFRRRVPAIYRILSQHNADVRPSLLHGDLWTGNVMRSGSDEPVFIDPAVHYGDREADLAMSELFGGFPAELYTAYSAEYPLPDGYEERRDIYNLYHVIHHFVLFGGGYLRQGLDMAKQFR